MFGYKHSQIGMKVVICSFAVIKLISRCVRIACSGLMMISSLQGLSKLDESWFSRLVIHKLDASGSKNVRQVYMNLHKVRFS